jgi:hypothetical protein
VSIGSAIKAALSRFADAFWRGFEEARAESVARTQSARSAAQPVPLDAGHPFFKSEDYKAALAGVIKAAFADGQNAEKSRVTEILRAPGAATFLEIAVDLALGDATGAQAAAVLGRAEADAATRAGAIKSNILDRASSHVTLH